MLVKFIINERSLKKPQIIMLGSIQHIFNKGCNHFLDLYFSENNYNKFPDMIKPKTGIQNIIYTGGSIRIVYFNIFANTVLLPPEKSFPFHVAKFNVTKSIESGPKYKAAGNVIKIVKPIKITLFITRPTYNLLYSDAFTGYNIIGMP